jgi:hypothetical protein
MAAEGSAARVRSRAEMALAAASPRRAAPCGDGGVGCGGASQGPGGVIVGGGREERRSASVVVANRASVCGGCGEHIGVCGAVFHGQSRVRVLDERGRRGAHDHVLPRHARRALGRESHALSGVARARGVPWPTHAFDRSLARVCNADGDFLAAIRLRFCGTSASALHAAAAPSRAHFAAIHVPSAGAGAPAAAACSNGRAEAGTQTPPRAPPPRAPAGRLSPRPNPRRARSPSLLAR